MTTSTKTRNAYGDGSCFQRHDHPTCPAEVDGVRPEHECRGTWLARAENGFTATGSRRRIEVTGQTETIARRKLRDRKRAIATGGPNATSTMTVKAWSEKYLEIAVRTLTPNAYKTSASNIKKWIVPTIGNRRLDRLTRGDLRRVQDAQRDAGNLASSIRRTHVVLIRMLKEAQAESGLVVPAGVLAMAAPPANESSRASMDLEQIARMLAQIAAAPDPSRWMGFLFQALRPGEGLGLCWDLIDFEQNVIGVGWQLQALPYVDRRDKDLGFRVPDGYAARHLEGRWHLVRPKTKSGIRYVPMTPWMRAALLTWRDTAPANEHGLVWATDDGHPIDPKDALADWRAMQVAAKIVHPLNPDDGYVLHEGRHTTATLLRAAGVDEDVIIAIMGHASYESTRPYVHNNLAELARRAMADLHDRIADAWDGDPLGLPSA